MLLSLRNVIFGLGLYVDHSMLLLLRYYDAPMVTDELGSVHDHESQLN